VKTLICLAGVTLLAAVLSHFAFAQQPEMATSVPSRFVAPVYGTAPKFESLPKVNRLHAPVIAAERLQPKIRASSFATKVCRRPAESLPPYRSSQWSWKADKPASQSSRRSAASENVNAILVSAVESDTVLANFRSTISRRPKAHRGRIGAGVEIVNEPAVGSDVEVVNEIELVNESPMASHFQRTQGLIPVTSGQDAPIGIGDHAPLGVPRLQTYGTPAMMDQQAWAARAANLDDEAANGFDDYDEYEYGETRQRNVMPPLWGGGERLYARSQYLRWKIKGTELPALVTTSPDGTPQDEAGVLGFPATTVLFGGSTIDNDFRAGGRLTIGYWLSSDDVFGIEVDYWQLENESNSFFVSSTGSSPIIARPFFNVDPNVAGNPGQDAALISFPNGDYTLPGFFANAPNQTGAITLNGSVDVRMTSEVRSGGIAFRGVSMLGPYTRHSRWDWLAGYRYFDMREGLTITDVVLPGPPFIAGLTITGTDRFKTTNTFHGGEISCAGRFKWNRLSADVMGRVAVGNMHQAVDISGTTVTFDPTPTTVTSDGSLLAQPSNSGRHRSNRVAVIPEISGNLSFHITKNIEVTAGCSLIYINRIMRPGDAIDTSLNPSTFGGAAGSGATRPLFGFTKSDALLFGYSGGVTARF
jgi:hypothetical protein